MSTIILKIQPADKFQEVHVLSNQNGVSSDKVYSVKLNELPHFIVNQGNVKEVHFEENMDEYLEYTVKPNFKEVGKVLGSRVKLLQDALNKRNFA